VQSLTWGDVGHQARCAAHWLRARELPQGSHIALISKNCAHWIIADLAIWMAGHVSVPLYPNLTADSVAHVLSHSEAALVFIGKLDDWPAMAPGVPAGVPTISLPLCPPGAFDFSWADLQACSPIQDNPQPAASDLATIIYTSGTGGVRRAAAHARLRPRRRPLCHDRLSHGPGSAGAWRQGRCPAGRQPPGSPPG
ncbi:MAG: AMP-binding protein, partial [Sphingomonadaceae bacterium]